MQKLMLMLLVGIIALAPAIAAAQLSSGAPGSTRPNSPLQGSGGPGTRPDYSGSETEPAGGVGRAQWLDQGAGRSVQLALGESVANLGRLREIHHPRRLREGGWRVAEGYEQVRAKVAW